ncbi:unnamed protein product [Prorocentrum cordatum]|uniref:Uncharacterized protein n=1 Tax=Prorocentrum cordatum TaxID=2364126 RepID=A0ABN9QB01_9DINO|nr:unnamed protein product [Polarella glacialis]
MDLAIHADYDREPSPTFFSIGAPRNVQFAEDQHAMVQWMQDAQPQPGHVNIFVNATARRFHMRAQVGSEMALPWALVLSGALKLLGGQRRRFSAPNVRGAETPLIVPADTSPKQVSRELQTKRLTVIAGGAHPGMELKTPRQSGHLQRGAMPMAEVRPQGLREQSKNWGPAAVAQMGINDDCIGQKFESAHERRGSLAERGDMLANYPGAGGTAAKPTGSRAPGASFFSEAAPLRQPRAQRASANPRQRASVAAGALDIADARSRPHLSPQPGARMQTQECRFQQGQIFRHQITRSDAIEIAADIPTHFSQRCQVGTAAGRSFIVQPFALIPRLHCQLNVAREAAPLSGARLSDRAAVALAIDAEEVCAPLEASRPCPRRCSRRLSTTPRPSCAAKEIVALAAELTRNDSQKLPQGSDDGNLLESGSERTKLVKFESEGASPPRGKAPPLQGHLAQGGANVCDCIFCAFCPKRHGNDIAGAGVESGEAPELFGSYHRAFPGAPLHFSTRPEDIHVGPAAHPPPPADITANLGFPRQDRYARSAGYDTSGVGRMSMEALVQLKTADGFMSLANLQAPKLRRIVQVTNARAAEAEGVLRYLRDNGNHNPEGQFASGKGFGRLPDLSEAPGPKCCKCASGTTVWSASGKCKPCDGQVELQVPAPQGCDPKDKDRGLQRQEGVRRRLQGPSGPR